MMKDTMRRFRSLRTVRIIGYNRVVLIAVTILMCLLFHVLSALTNRGNVFLTHARLTSAVNYGYFICFLALGVTFVIATGGSGSVTGTFLGVVLISLLQVGLPFIGLNADWQLLITGGILLAAVLIEKIHARRLACAGIAG